MKFRFEWLYVGSLTPAAYFSAAEQHYTFAMVLVVASVFLSLTGGALQTFLRVVLLDMALRVAGFPEKSRRRRIAEMLRPPDRDPPP